MSEDAKYEERPQTLSIIPKVRRTYVYCSDDRLQIQKNSVNDFLNATVRCIHLEGKIDASPWTAKTRIKMLEPSLVDNSLFDIMRARGL